MDRTAALAFAFSAGLKVRGNPVVEAANVALAIHASRTVDGRIFFARDKQLASRAVKILEEDGRGELALQVGTWANDAGVAVEGSERFGLDRAVRAYAGAKAWAEQGAQGPPMWIRDVPRAPAEREVLASRLLLTAKAKGSKPLAQAALEAAMADLPHPRSFSTVLHAAAFAGTPEAFTRTMEGLSAPHPAAGAHLSRLREALELEAGRAGGSTAAQLLGGRLQGLDGAIVAHVAAAAYREGQKEEALAALAAARAGAAKESLVCVLFVERALGEARAVDPMALAAPGRPTHAQFTAGACDAARALRSAAPVIAAMRLFDPEDVGTAPNEATSAQLVKELVREGADVAAAAADLESLRLIYASVRRMGLKQSWEIFMRARIADACAHLAAAKKSEDAWELAMDAAMRGMNGFERAKMRSRAACEFIRALEVPELGRPVADLYFAPEPPRPAASGEGNL